MVGSKWRTWGNMTGALGWSSGYMLLPVIVYLIPDMKKLEGRKLKFHAELDIFKDLDALRGNMKNWASSGKLFNLNKKNINIFIFY